jgi:DNA-binding MarR family transcriptional regulator
VPRKTQVGRLSDIEIYMHEVNGHLSALFSSMAKNSIGIMGMPINVSQLKAMSAFNQDTQYSMGELCKLTQVKMPSMTEVADKLEAEGMFKRVRDKKDRRVVRINLTKQGKAMHDKIMASRNENLKEVFGELNEKEQTTLLNSLKNVADILSKVAENEKG